MYKKFSFATAVFGWMVCMGKGRVGGKEIVGWLLGLELVVRNYKKWWFCSEDMGV